MLPQRDQHGKFLPGNTVCFEGWQGLVNRRFNGDLHIAREYVAQLGRYSYGKQCDSVASSHNMKLRLNSCFYHPGSPESFAELYKSRFEFDLETLKELEF